MAFSNNITKIYEKSFYSNNRIWIIAYVVDCCNYNCHYCYNKKPRSNKCLDLNELEHFLVKVHQKTNKNIDLELIGGEPTLHPNICSFCKKLSSYEFMSIKLFTNLSQSIDFYSKLLQLNNLEIFASWHSTTFDKQNQSFVDKAKQLDSNKIVYCVMFENDNWNNSTFAFESLLNICSTNVETSLIGGDDDNAYEYTAEQRKNYKKCIQPKLDKKFNCQYTIELKDGSCSTTSFNELYLNDDVSFKNWKCDAGYNHLYVHSNGNVYKCQSCYDYNDAAFANIYNQKSIDDMHFKPVICKFDACSCTYSIKKENLRTLTSYKHKNILK